MEFNRHICRRLHEEHDATLALWGKVEQSFASGAGDAALMKKAAGALEHEIAEHFDFEENQLFPRLAASGEGDIGELLLEEHVVIRAASRRFVELVRADPAHAELRRLAMELAERLFAHVQKEEMSLLPALDDLIDEIADQELTEAYLAP